MAKSIKPTEVNKIYVVLPGRQVALANKHNPNGQPSIRTAGSVIFVEEISEELAKSFITGGRIKSLSKSNEFEAEEMERILNPPKNNSQSLVIPKPAYNLDPAQLDAMEFNDLVKIFAMHTGRVDHPDTKQGIIQELSKNFEFQEPAKEDPKAAKPTMNVDLSTPPPPLDS